jgi:hypothetical protein
MRKRCFSIWAILGVILAGLGRSDARQAVTTNLAAYWPMDTFASNSTPDASGNGHAATQADALKQPSPSAGLFGGSLSFDGVDNFLSAPDSAGLNAGLGSFTVAAWVKPSGTSLDRLANKWNGTVGWVCDLNTAAGGSVVAAGYVRMRLSDGSHTVDQAANAGLVAGAWTHVAVTVDRTAKLMKFYANGVQVGSNVDISTVALTLTNAAAFGIGNIPSAGANYYAGALDEVRFYTAALTQPQVLTLVQPLPPTALTANPVKTTVTLNWTASAGSLSYRVYRSSTSGSGYTQIASGLTVTTYDDIGVPYDSTSYYVVRGFNNVEGNNSNQALASIGPRPPRGAVADDHNMCGIGTGGVTGSAFLIVGLTALTMVLAALRKSS